MGAELRRRTSVLFCGILPDETVLSINWDKLIQFRALETTILGASLLDEPHETFIEDLRRAGRSGPLLFADRLPATR
jgi:hypothetical protein